MLTMTHSIYSRIDLSSLNIILKPRRNPMG